MSEKKSNSKLITAVVAVLIVVIAAVGIFCFNSKSGKSETSTTGTGSKTVTIEVVHKDSTSKEFECKTDAETLETVLLDEGIVENNQTDYGLYILTADGETVDESNEEWWCLTKDGETLMTGASETEVADGDHYEITFTEGY